MTSHLVQLCLTLLGNSYLAAASPTCYPSGGRFTQADWPYCFVAGNNLVYSGKSADGNFMRLGMYAQGHTGGWSALAVAGNGGMKGAREIVVRKDAYREDSWIAEDRYSNSYAMPTLQNTQQVTLMFAEEQSGNTAWGVLLPMNGCSGELDGLATNYPLNEDIDRYVLWALGSSHTFGYHTSATTKRGFLMANLYSGPKSIPDTAGLEQFSLSMPNVPVQNGPNGKDARNTFMCAVFDISQLTTRDLTLKHHVAMFEPVLQDISKQYVHHMILLTCSTQPSTHGGTAIPHQGTVQDCSSMVHGCNNMIWAWAPGNTPIVAPSNVGFPIGSGHTWMALQIHYYNPSLTPNVRDSAGVTLKLAEHTRPMDAGLLNVNGGTDASMRRAMPAGQQDVSISMTTPSQCTQWAPGTSLNVLGVIHHEHQYGKSMNLDVYRSGNYVGPLRRENHYDYNFQSFAKGPVKTLTSGDELKLTCRYNTLGATQPVTFGENTQEEMCIVSLLVYPPPPTYTWMDYEGDFTPDTPVKCHNGGQKNGVHALLPAFTPTQYTNPACTVIGNLASAAATTAIGQCISCQWGASTTMSTTVSLPSMSATVTLPSISTTVTLQSFSAYIIAHVSKAQVSLPVFSIIQCVLVYFLNDISS